MSDFDALVEKAAEAVYNANRELFGDGKWGDYDADAEWKDQWRRDQRAALEAVGLPALLERVEAGDPDWSNCVHGVKDGCSSFRCGSNCGQTYDRMHPCLACVTAEMVELHADRDALAAKVARVEALLVDPTLDHVHDELCPRNVFCSTHAPVALRIRAALDASETP